MKTSLSLLVCWVVLPLLASAQTTPTVTSKAGPTSENHGLNSLSKPVQPPAMTLHTPDPSSDSNSLGETTVWNGPKNEVLIEQRSPQVSLGKTKVPVSGFLVDVFRRAPDSEIAPTVAQRIMGRTTSVSPAAAQRAFSWQGEYFKWGSSDAPWSVVSAAPPLQPMSALFSVHH